MSEPRSPTEAHRAQSPDPGPPGAGHSPGLRALLWTLLVGVLLVITGLAVHHRLDRRPQGPPVLGRVPPFSLVDQQGEAITHRDLTGRPWVADFIFTRCALSCPMMTTRMATLDDELPPEVALVSVTVDPEHDTPEILADYAAAFGASERWYFLTGPEEEILGLVSAGFHLAVDPDPPPGTASPQEPIVHSTRFALVDAEGRIRGYYDGMSAQGLELLRRDLRGLEGR